jgi:hypothetical protein
MVTSNHVHLLAFDNEGRNVIPDSMKLVAGRTGQEYNVRKNRKGAFWEDRYHATAVESNRYLRKCITYIDMNMVRAGVVEHPTQWEFCGYSVCELCQISWLPAACLSNANPNAFRRFIICLYRKPANRPIVTHLLSADSRTNHLWS